MAESDLKSGLKVRVMTQTSVQSPSLPPPPPLFLHLLSSSTSEPFRGVWPHHKERGFLQLSPMFCTHASLLPLSSFFICSMLHASFLLSLTFFIPFEAFGADMDLQMSVRFTEDFPP